MFDLCYHCKRLEDCEFQKKNPQLVFLDGEEVKDLNFVPEWVKVANYFFNGGFAYVVYKCDKFEEIYGEEDNDKKSR